MADEIINKVSNSKLITLDLEELYPEGERVLFDIKDWLFDQIILKEMMKCTNLLNITDISTKEEVMQEIREEYDKLKKAKDFPPSKGEVPSSYVIPKNKDIFEKNMVGCVLQDQKQTCM